MAARRVRSGRTEGAEPTQRTGTTVAVLGDGPVGAAVAAGLAGRGPVRRLGLEATTPEADLRAALDGAGAAVVVAHRGDLAAWLAEPAARRRQDAVTVALRAVAAARETGVGHVVLLSSAMVHGPRTDGSVIHDADPLGAPDGGVVGDLLAVEAAVASAMDGGPRLSVLRPAALVGPGVDTLVTRHFEAPRLLVVRGAAREWQFIHLDDLAAAVAHVLDHALAGSLTVGAEGALSTPDVVRLARLRRIELSEATAFGTAERLHRVGVLPAPASDLAFAIHPWTVASDGLRASGWRPSVGNEACLRELVEAARGRLALAGRRVGQRDVATLGTAGAAIAVLGTAALWRQSRGRRR